MGQTLTNGIFLPTEGERNCYEGLAGNWRAIDGYIGDYNVHVADAVIHVSQADRNKWDAVENKADASALTAHTGNTTIHVTAADKEAWNGKADASALTAHAGDTTIHVTAADKEAWNGKADASALTAHTGNTTIHVTAADKEAWNGKADASALTAHTANTTIHVTAEDKTKWDAVTRKADDADAVHKSGAETIGGLKTFTDLMSIDGDYLGNEASINQRTNLQLRSNRDTEGKSGALITRFRQNRTQGGMQTADFQMLGFDFLENEVRTNNILSVQATGWADSVPTKVYILSSIGDYSYGNSARPCKINDNNPGALSLPDISAGVDISGYITAGNTHNEYTPTVDGWISVIIKKTTTSGALAIFLYQGDVSNSYFGNTTLPNDTEFCGMASIPVKAGAVVNIDLRGSNTYVYSAKFYPCRGNV